MLETGVRKQCQELTSMLATSADHDVFYERLQGLVHTQLEKLATAADIEPEPYMLFAKKPLQTYREATQSYDPITREHVHHAPGTLQQTVRYAQHGSSLERYKFVSQHFDALLEVAITISNYIGEIAPGDFIDFSSFNDLRETFLAEYMT